ncbi:uncharacterized protein LOC127848860 isoform X1 [Dreissena polymorpha]|nr:uncharacterized protein LOC127848860 isoform X1 [Dreissena polymorpha]
MADIDCDRKKSKMMSPMEIEVIREFMFDNINQMQESHSNGGPGAARKVRLLWEQLTEKVNAVGNGPRTVNQVKMKWNNMKKNAKKEVTDQKLGLAGTGGGRKLPEMTKTSAAVSELFAGSASFHGVSDDADTAIFGDLSSQAAYDALVDLVPLIEAAKVGSSLFLDCQGSNGHATETPQVTDEPAIVPVDATVPVSDVKFVATKVSEPTKKPQKNVATGKTAKSNITVPAKCNITVPNPRSLKEMQLAYFQHQNSLSVAQEAYYLKMASLADKLNVLADIAIDKIHKNE